MMEFIEHTSQLVALAGYDGEGQRTVISICTPDGIEKTCQVIFDAWHTTEQIHQFRITLSGVSEAVYTREGKE